MRRMITGKQVDALDQLNKHIEIDNDNDATIVSGDGYLYLNSATEDPYAQIGISDAPAINLLIHGENAEQLESKLLVDEDKVRITGALTVKDGDENTLLNVGHDEDQYQEVKILDYTFGTMDGDNGLHGDGFAMIGASESSSGAVITLTNSDPDADDSTSISLQSDIVKFGGDIAITKAYGSVVSMGTPNISIVSISFVAYPEGVPAIAQSAVTFDGSVSGLGYKARDGYSVEIEDAWGATPEEYSKLSDAVVDALNQWAPATFTLKFSGQLDSELYAYGITNTKITIGDNVYLFDSSDEEAYVLQGTWQNLSYNASIERSLKVNTKHQEVAMYNS